MPAESDHQQSDDREEAGRISREVETPEELPADAGAPASADATPPEPTHPEASKDKSPTGPTLLMIKLASAAGRSESAAAESRTTPADTFGEVADPEDLHFESLLIEAAVKSSWVSTADANKCIEVLVKAREQGESRSLVEVLVEEGVLTASQLQTLSGAVSKEPAAGGAGPKGDEPRSSHTPSLPGQTSEGTVPSQAGADSPDSDSDLRLAEFAIERGMASTTDVQDCLSAMVQAREQGRDVALEELLVEKGVLTENQAQTLIELIHLERVGGEPETIAGFQLLEKIGEGGMGTVHRARQVTLDRIVAFKTLPERLAANPEFVTRFLREARAAAKLDHPNIVRAIDAGEAEGTYYFVMEFVDGQSLEDILQKRGKLPEEEVLGIAIQTARGLDCAWRGGLVHRDIKPDNILLTQDGVAKIADLGLAKELEGRDATRLTQEGYLMGSPHYISPEQAKGEDVDIRTDIYALGATLYRMVTGDTPFHGKDAVSLIMARYHDDPKPANEMDSSVSHEMAQVIATMMARDREFRYPDPAVLLHDLERLAEGKRPEFAGANESARRRALEAADSRRMHRATGAIVVQRRRKGGVALISVVAIVAAAAVAAALFFMGRMRDKAPGPPGPAQLSAEELARREEEKVRREEEEARRKALETTAAKFHAVISENFEAKEYAEVVKKVDEAGDKYVATEVGSRLDRLRRQAGARIEEARLRAEAEAEKGRRYQELIELARDELAAGDYGTALGLLGQAKGIMETEEVVELVKEAKLIQHRSRAEDAERVGKLADAIRLYGLALAIKDDPKLRERARGLERKLSLADRLATGDRLSGESRWVEAKEAYAQALELARGRERPEIEKKTRAAELEIRYTEDIGRARDAIGKKVWKEAISHARAALAIKPDDRIAHALIEQARDALGPEPEITNSIGMQFILIPAGEFTMGSDKGDEDERPVHKVLLGAYYVGKFEVTNAQFEQFSPTHRQKWKEYSPDDEMPVIAVSWDEAMAFCRWLSKKEGVEYRLPTEAEWERAARGTDARVYPWGNEAPDAGGTYRCNFAPTKARDSWKLDGFELISPVGAFQAGVSPCGSHDMAGNVWEWCLDWYGKTWYSTSDRSNPRGPDGGAKHVLRGGSMTSGAKALRCTYRISKPSTFYEANIGFRCVRAVRKGRLLMPSLEK